MHKMKGLVRTFSTSLQLMRKEKWDLLSGVCLERKPIITRELNELEKKFSEMLAQIEYENSYKCDHEMRKEQERKQAEALKEGKAKELDLDLTLKQTAQDLEDVGLEEYKNFQFAPRTTDADKENDKHSLNRMLDRHLLLVLQQKLGDQFKWVLPQGKRQDGESMRQTAERILGECCGDDLKVQFMGNAPCGFYKYKYPKHVAVDDESAAVGAKVFFFKAQYVTGTLQNKKDTVKDFVWLGRKELDAVLQGSYYRSVSQFLINED